MSLTLAARLRAETAGLHAQAEQTPFMAALTGGRLDRRACCLMLRSLVPVYRELEGGLALNASHPSVAPVRFPALLRMPALQLDLQVLHGPLWEEELAVMPAGLDYARRLSSISQSGPGLLAAHAYVRYLGDLSGGQMLRGITTRSLGLAPGGGGTAFYEFGPPAEVAALGQALRAGLNAIAPDAASADADAIVAEAKWSFEMHGLLFAELAQAAGLTPLQ
ncbi:MAG: biliverdin-producing heme oxygenase [Pseudomonadota bacterium]